MGCTVEIRRGVICAERSARNELGTPLGMGRKHAMKANEIEPGSWHEGGQALHKFQWGHHDVGGAILVRAFELGHDIAGAVECEPFMGDGRACDSAAQRLEFVALIHGAAHLGVETEPLGIGTALLGRRRTKGDGLQRQDFLTRSGSECNAIGASRRL